MDSKKNFLEDVSKDKPESFQEEVFVTSPKKLNRFIAPLIGIIIVMIAVLAFTQLTATTVPDMSGWKLENIQSWAEKSHKNTKLNGIYTKETALHDVISQDIPSGSRINSNKLLTVTYSLGADPEETVDLPDFKSMKLIEIKDWIRDNQMNGITIKYESSEIIPKDEVISYEFIEGSEEEFLRKNRMVVYVSSGTVDLNETLTIEDFYGKTQAEVLQWAKENQMEITIKDEFNEYVEYGKIFEQNIKKDTKITRSEEVILKISRGKPITVPVFEGMSRSEASELAAIYGISLFYKLVISEEAADTVLSQDIAAGEEVDIKQIITLQIAKEEGKILVPNFTGLTTSEVNSLAGLYGLKVFVKDAAEAGENGIVISQSIAPGNKIDTDQIITLMIKEDKRIKSPNFVGLTKNEAMITAKNLGLELLFEEINTTKKPNQTIIEQNIQPKTMLEQGESILLTIAVNSGIKAENLWKMSLKEAQAWALQQGITLNVIDYYSDHYPAGTLYYQEPDARQWIPLGKVLTVYHSLGLVMVDNFIGKTKADLIKWRDEVNSKGADISLIFTPDYDTSKSKGVITEQDMIGELVNSDQTIEVKISATDQGILIKNFEGSNLDDFKLWCDTNSVPYIISECYSEVFGEGTLYNQNYKDTYLPKGEYLRIVQSLGKIFVNDFTNQTKASVVDWQKDVKKKKGNINIIFLEEYSFTIEAGRIIDQSVKDKEIDSDETIFITVSKGK